ncbi:DUF2934 domain-containing protein [Methylobacterium sp. WL19]|uniref:DUF2934 domain-containing protein n=1 Tax=Methylobacterium sp. WL19 TaxID=2603896 RepID=UPI001FEF8D52|nr:DUF2934 domain-containing protein [Methylobacterium sp. WL19]
MSTIAPDRIRARAYELWDRNHRPGGLDMQFWLVAERELKAEDARKAGHAAEANEAKGKRIA